MNRIMIITTHVNTLEIVLFVREFILEIGARVHLSQTTNLIFLVM